MTTVIYRRQSLDRKNDELGIERQLKECRRVAKTRGLQVSEVITDNSVSASKRGRPGYDRLVQMMTDHRVETVIILRIDRLLRLNDELEELIQLVEQHPVKVITAEGEVDLSTPQGRLVARILVSVARSEMELKSARHKLANQQKAEAGKPHGGRRCYGYEADGLTIREDEAVVLKEMAHRTLMGQSYRDIAAWLNQAGITTAQGCKWFPITVRNILTRKRYAGIRHYDGVDYPAAWPAIFDEATWAELQLVIARRKEKAGNQPVAKKYLLTGLLFCGKCGGPLNGETKRDHPSRPIRKTYQCRTCHGVTRGAEPLEHWLGELVIYRLDSPALGELLEAQNESADLAELLDRQAGLKAKLDSLLSDYVDDVLTKAEFVKAKRRAESALEAVESELTAVIATRTTNGLLRAGESVRVAWQTRPDSWKRQLLALLIDRVVVQVGKTKPFYWVDGRRFRFDPELVTVAWKV